MAVGTPALLQLVGPNALYEGSNWDLEITFTTDGVTPIDVSTGVYDHLKAEIRSTDGADTIIATFGYTLPGTGVDGVVNLTMAGSELGSGDAGEHKWDLFAFPLADESGGGDCFIGSSYCNVGDGATEPA